jgi:hypothetical protein
MKPISANAPILAACSRATAAARRCGILLLVLATAACYDVQHEVFRQKDGVVLPGLEGDYTKIFDSVVKEEPENIYTISRIQRSANYQVSAHHDGVVTQVGELRVVPLGHDLYIAQLHYSRDVYLFAVMLMRVTWSGGTVAEVTELQPTGEVALALAERDGVDMWDQDKGANGVSGSHAALVRFLRHLATVPASAVRIYRRVPEGG